MKHKKIQYVSLEAGAFLSDLVFQVMAAEERGVYCSLIFYLYENNGALPFNTDYLNQLCNCRNFEKVWEFIKQKFKVKNGIISHKRVSRELDRARHLLQGQSEKGVKGNDVRWREHRTAIAQQSPDNRQVKRSEVIEANRSEVNGSNNNSNSAFQSVISSLRHGTLTNGELETLRFRIYDILCGIFRGRTVSDSAALRNFTKWVKENIAAGKFQPEVFKTIVNMATDSKNGKSRKPIAVFFAQVKKELGYKNNA